MFRGSLKTVQGVRRGKKSVLLPDTLESKATHASQRGSWKARERDREGRHAGRQAYGQRVEKRADVSTSCGQKKKKKRNKRCAKRRSTHK